MKRKPRPNAPPVMTSVSQPPGDPSKLVLRLMPHLRSKHVTDPREIPANRYQGRSLTREARTSPTPGKSQ